MNTKPHYAWAVTLGGGVALFSAMGLVVNVFSIYQPYIIAAHNFTNTQASWITTIRSLFGLLTLFVVGYVIQKIDLRATMTLGMVFAGISFCLFGMAETFPGYCLGAAFGGMAYSLAGNVPLSLAIARWFDHRRGWALGVAMAGSGISTVIAPVLLNASIQHFGLAPTFFMEAALLFVLALVVFVLIRNHPQDMGLVPYRNQGTQEIQEKKRVPKGQPQGFTSAMYAIALAVPFLVAGPSSIGCTHITVLYTTAGLDEGTVAALVSFFGLLIIFGKILAGYLCDKLGTYRANYALGGMGILSFALCCLANNLSVPVALCAVGAMALSIPISSVSFSFWAADFSDEAQYEKRLRYFTIAYMLGCLAFGPMPGILADRYGSYIPAYFIFFLMAILILVLIQFLYLRLGLTKKPAVTA